MSRQRSLSPPRIPQTCRLGILGTRNQITSAEITALLDLIVENQGENEQSPSSPSPSGTIQAVYLPQEGMSSIYAESYFDAAEVPVTALDANWARHGRAAVARRDSEIIRSATHFLVFGGPRSTRPLTVATDLARKGRTVYYLPHGSLDLELLELATCPGPEQVKPDRKVSKGKGSSRQPTLEEVYS